MSKILSNLYTKYQTCKETQNTLLKHIKSKVTEEHNNQLIKPLAKKWNKISNISNGKPEISRDWRHSHWVLSRMLQPTRRRFISITYKYTISRKKSTKTMKQAILTLIPKKSELEDLQNWRPIPLLCIDYKILTKFSLIDWKNTTRHNLWRTKLFNTTKKHF